MSHSYQNMGYIDRVDLRRSLDYIEYTVLLQCKLRNLHMVMVVPLGRKFAGKFVEKTLQD